jgi:hypothetical protein
MLEPCGDAAKAVLQGGALPYGYTITIWSTGAVLTGKHGSPGVGFVFLFAVGAIAGFAAVALIGAMSRSEPLEPAPRDLLVTGVTHVAAVGASIGATALIADMRNRVAWPLAAFAATAIYLAVASLELQLAHRSR